MFNSTSLLQFASPSAPLHFLSFFGIVRLRSSNGNKKAKWDMHSPLVLCVWSSFQWSLRFSLGSRILDLYSAFSARHIETSFYSLWSIHYFVLLVPPYLCAILQCKVLSWWRTAWLQWPLFESMGSVLIFATPRVGVQFFILLFFSVSLLLLTLPTKILPSEFLWEASTYTPKFKVNEEGQQAIFNHKFSKFPFFRSNDRPRNKLTDSAAWQAFYQRLRCLCSYLNPCKCLFSE